MTPPNERREIVRLYVEDGLSTHDIGRKIGRASSYVGSILTRAGIKMRTRQQAMDLRFKNIGFPSDHLAPRVLELRKENTSLWTIAKSLNLNIKTVRDILERRKEI